MKKKLKILGVCAGNGVMLHPLKRWVIGNVEPRQIFHTKEELQWNSNFTVPMTKDFHRFFKGSDIIIGHPDCGHSSVLSHSRLKGKSDPKKNHSLGFYFKSINKYKPKLFVMENLPTLLKTFNRKLLKEVIPGYRFKIFEDSVVRFGNSQHNRKRLLIIGFREDLSTQVDKCFMIPQDWENPQTTKDLIGDLQDLEEDFSLGHIREPNDTIITLYSGYKMKVEDVQKVWLNELKGHSRWIVRNRNFSTAPGVYRNLPDEYPLTVRKGNREFNPMGLMMSPRERARIQGIPDTFKIYAEPKDKGYWINKGRVTVTKTPPYEIGLWIKHCLKKAKKYFNYG